MKGDWLLKSIRLKNVRSLKDTDTVSLSPITLLVGENSSGKSTFLRLFPLIKQSLGKRTAGPLLWAGAEGDYVDMGSFDEVVTNDGSKSISFSFSVPLSRDMTFSPRYDIGRIMYPYRRLLQETIAFWGEGATAVYSFVLTRAQAEAGGQEYVSHLSVELGGTSFEMDLPPVKPPRSIRIDGVNLDISNKDEPEKRTRYYSSSISYNSFFDVRMPDIAGTEQWLYQRLFSEEMFEQMRIVTSTKNAIVLSDASEEIRAAVILAGELLCAQRDLTEIRSFANSNAQGKRYKTLMSHLCTLVDQLEGCEKQEAQELTAGLKLCFIHQFIPSLDEYLFTYFGQVHYIAPLRATAERYYRLRNLAIDEVDYQGKNLAIFLSGLPKQRLNQFQEWTTKQFGFKVVPESEGSHHLSVGISAETGTPVNLSDTGFGYSQILPIITQLWDLSTRKPSHSNMDVPLVIAIEQPELHLHPALQARLANAFIACLNLAQENGYQLQLILETHSQTIVNYFGRAIARGSLAANDVSVVLFDRSHATNYSRVRTSWYDKNGYLQDWPTGFFDVVE